MNTAPFPCRRCSARLTLHVAYLDHQGFGSRIIGSDRNCIMHAPKNDGLPLQIRTGHHSAGGTTAPPTGGNAGPHFEKNTQENRLFQSRASLVFLRIVIVKYFTISSCSQGRGKYWPAKMWTAPALPAQSIDDNVEECASSVLGKRPRLSQHRPSLNDLRQGWP